MKYVIAHLISVALPLAAIAATSADQPFATKATQANLAEIAAGKLAKTTSSTASVRAYASKMVEDHTMANATLNDLAMKSQITVPTEPSAEQKAAASKLAELKGVEFDHAYVQMMIADHTEVVALFRNEASTGKDDRLKSFAATTLPTIEMHLDMAKKLGDAPPAIVH